MTINIGPQHPATHGVFRMVLTVDGEVVTDVEPYIGYLHRGARKAHREPQLPPVHGLVGPHGLPRGHVLRGRLLHGGREARRDRSPGSRGVHPRDDDGALPHQLATSSSSARSVPTSAPSARASSTPGASASASTTSSKRSRATACSRRTSASAVVTMDLPENFESRIRWLLGSIQQGLDDFDGLLTGNEIFVERCRGLSPVTPAAGHRLGPDRPLPARDGPRLRRAQGRALLASTRASSSKSQSATLATSSTATSCASPRCTRA